MSKLKNRYVYLALVAIAVFIFMRLISGSGDLSLDNEPTNNNDSKSVEVASVAELNGAGIPLSLVGSVRAASEVELLAESQGLITRVSFQPGNFVPAGSVIAEIENSRERASLLQAEGALESAKAALDTVSQSSESLNRRNAINASRSAFASADDAIRNKIDIFFSNSRGNQPDLLFVTSTQLESDLEFGRFVAEETLNNWALELDDIDNDDNLLETLESHEENLDKLASFLDTLAIAVNRLEPSAKNSATTLASWKSAVLASRSSVNTAKISLAGAKEGLIARDNSPAQAEGSVKQAEGALALARANYEKTLVRTPIAGTLDTLTVSRGDFVNIFEPVASVSGNGNFEIRTFISQDDLESIEVGNKVEIEGGVAGTVSRVSSALDRQSKKIEVRISAPANADLISGQSVSLKILRSETSDIDLSEFVIPLSAVKITGEGSFVFILDSESKLVASDVVLGSPLGSNVIILEGLTAEMTIVLDARGLKEGQTVEIKN